MFANGLGDQGLIPGWVIPKTKKIVLDAALHSTEHYKARIKVKLTNPRKGVAPLPTPHCSSYWKESLWIALDNTQPSYIYIYIYIYINRCIYEHMQICAFTNRILLQLCRYIFSGVLIDFSFTLLTCQSAKTLPTNPADFS